MNKNIQTFLGCDSEYADAEIALFGVPFDGTTSYRPGTRFGPSAIRSESFGIETYSPYSGRDLTEIAVFDGGDLELPFGNPQRVLDLTQDYTARLLEDGKLPVMLGGEHLVTLGAAAAVLECFPDLHIIHFDAHTDLREEYLGESLTHAGVIRRLWDLVGDGRIHQFGIRSGERHEFEFAHAHTDFHPFSLEDFARTAASLTGVPVYFTLDLDVLDPAFFSGTGTPEAGGVTSRELLDAIGRLSRLDVVGCDIVELAPHYDASGASTALACKITREILLQVSKKGD